MERIDIEGQDIPTCFKYPVEFAMPNAMPPDLQGRMQPETWNSFVAKVNSQLRETSLEVGRMLLVKLAIRVGYGLALFLVILPFFRWPEEYQWLWEALFQGETWIFEVNEIRAAMFIVSVCIVVRVITRGRLKRVVDAAVKSVEEACETATAETLGLTFAVADEGVVRCDKSVPKRYISISGLGEAPPSVVAAQLIQPSGGAVVVATPVVVTTNSPAVPAMVIGHDPGEAAAASAAFCTGCGAARNEGANFCGGCGKRFGP